MAQFNTPQTAVEKELLISFCDLSNFGKLSRQKTDLEIFSIMSEIAEIIGTVVEKSGGKVVKFIGDAALIVFDSDDADIGTKALLEMKTEVDSRLNSEGIKSQLCIQAHFGSTACGLFGTKSDKRFDLFGDAVNTAATLKSHGISITPQLFRKLEPETRKFFKKHTPPVRYISAEERHKE